MTERFADLHVHTTGSPDAKRKNGLTPVEAVKLAEATTLSALAITDHNNLRSAVEAVRFAEVSGLSVDVIPGIEISSEEGHIIALYVADEIPKGLTAVETIKRIHDQNGLVIIPHPFNSSKGVRIKTLETVSSHPDEDVYADGFEVFNAGVLDNSLLRGRDNTNILARKIYSTGSLQLGAAVGVSDSHRLTVGRGRTKYSGDLKDAILKKTTEALMPSLEEQERILFEASRLFGRERIAESYDIFSRTKKLSER